MFLIWNWVRLAVGSYSFSGSDWSSTFETAGVEYCAGAACPTIGSDELIPVANDAIAARVIHVFRLFAMRLLTTLKPHRGGANIVGTSGSALQATECCRRAVEGWSFAPLEYARGIVAVLKSWAVVCALRCDQTRECPI